MKRGFQNNCKGKFEKEKSKKFFLYKKNVVTFSFSTNSFWEVISSDDSKKLTKQRRMCLVDERINTSLF